MKPVVFISSVAKGYEYTRKVAREAICNAGGRPVGFEDFPALDKSPWNSCLDGVQAGDVYVGIFGARYGFETPRGRSATEEEYDEAGRLGKRRLLFLEEVAGIEEKQQAFLSRVGDYHHGRFWKKFSTAEDLEGSLRQALKEVFQNLMRQYTLDDLKTRLHQELSARLENHYNQSWLVTAAMPDGRASLTDDVSFNQDALARRVFLAGQEGEPPVFEIELMKTKALKEDHWLLEQTQHQNWRQGQRLVVLRLYLDACVVIAMNVTGRDSSHYDQLSDLHYIYPEAVDVIARAQLAFLTKVYDCFDPYLRWDRVAVMSSLHNTEHRNFERPRPGQTSHSIAMRGSNDPILAFEDPRILERHQLEKGDYPATLVASFARKLS